MIFSTSLTGLLLIPLCLGFSQVANIPHQLPWRSSSTRLFVDGQGVAGGSQHLLGDIIRSLQPRYLSQVADAVQSNLDGMPTVQLDSFCEFLQDEIPSWLALQDQLPPEAIEDGPSTSATVRLFGRSNQPIVTFYRDSAAWCPYCQKVWIALEEMQIPYKVVKVDMRCYGQGKPSEFLRLQPNGNLPCAVFRENGKEWVVGESNDIVDEFDQLSANLPPAKTPPALRPRNSAERIRDLCDNGRESLERRLYTRWMWWLTGVRRPEEYKALFLEHWQEVEDALAEDKSGPYFLGKDISIVDIRFIPFVERQLASLTYFKGADYLRDARRYPSLVKWLEAMESRPSYQASRSDYYTHSRSLPPQLAAECVSEAGACEEMQAAIDSWPVGDGSSNWVEPSWQRYKKNAATEAAAKLIQGNDKIVAFSARGAGISGLPAASAPLADPAATPNKELMPAVDLMLRYAASLLLGKTRKGNLMASLLGTTVSSRSRFIDEAVAALDEGSKQALADCLDYLRERIGVPRDMSYPAARALRGALLDIKGQILSPDEAVQTR